MRASEEFLTPWAAAGQAGGTTTLKTQPTGDLTAAGPPGLLLTKQAWPGLGDRAG